MHDKAGIRLFGGKIPNNNVGLEAHVSDLARSDEASTFRHRYARDIVIVSDHKVLVSGLQIFHNYIAADRVNHVHAVRMNFESVRHFAL